MQRHEWIIRELNRLAKMAEAIQTRYQSYLGLHHAAAMSGDKDEMRQRRDEVHTVLDALLDNGEAIQGLARELEDNPPD